ncbi:caspase activity and apoptosis inhibitor 1 [Bombina bombina]|uniref:caspase activity and apoptosis inhibitor 1 n=1 Tax=Bombina bombina TaxID=8345 RepID=UPI00235AA572|nr:caspase activity and apoptosis inhibitor 1 [Bombina bombina]
MTGGKKSSKEKKKKRRSEPSETELQGDRKKRNTEQRDPEALSPPPPVVNKDDEAEEPSDIEEGGLDLNVPLKPISFYISSKEEMLQQCFRVVGEKKLQKMLPDLLKGYSSDDIKKLCLEQLEQMSEKKLLNILEGEHGLDSATDEETDGPISKSGADLMSQQDNNVDSTSSLRDNTRFEDADSKIARGEDCDALSINADTSDSDIEGVSCEERSHEVPVVVAPKIAGQSDDLVMDIEKSVNEILGLAEPVAEEEQSATIPILPEEVQPSAQQLELLELEMRARAIKALMKAGEVKKS